MNTGTKTLYFLTRNSWLVYLIIGNHIFTYLRWGPSHAGLCPLYFAVAKFREHYFNTPGTAGGPGGRDRTLAVKSIKTGSIWQIGPGSMWQIGPGSIWQIGPGSMWQTERW